MDKLIKVLEAALPNIDFKSSKTLVADGVLNSLAIVTLIVELSDAYGIEFPFEEMTAENFESIENIQHVITKLSN